MKHMSRSMQGFLVNREKLSTFSGNTSTASSSKWGIHSAEASSCHPGMYHCLDFALKLQQKTPAPSWGPWYLCPGLWTTPLHQINSQPEILPLLVLKYQTSQEMANYSYIEICVKWNIGSAKEHALWNAADRPVFLSLNVICLLSLCWCLEII